MPIKTPSAEVRIAAFLALFQEAHAARFLVMSYDYDENGEFPEGINRLNPDPTGERHTWQPNTQLYWTWRRALETFASRLKEEGHPLDIYRALIALERRPGMGMHRAADWIRSQDFPKFYQDWCTAR